MIRALLNEKPTRFNERSQERPKKLIASLAYPKAISGLRKPIAIQEAISLNINLLETTIVPHVAGKLDVEPPLFCHHPHFRWRRVFRNSVSENRQSVSLGEVEEQCGITARGNDQSGGRIGLEPMLLKILLAPPYIALDPSM